MFVFDENTVNYLTQNLEQCWDFENYRWIRYLSKLKIPVFSTRHYSVSVLFSYHSTRILFCNQFHISCWRLHMVYHPTDDTYVVGWALVVQLCSENVFEMFMAGLTTDSNKIDRELRQLLSLTVRGRLCSFEISMN